MIIIICNKVMVELEFQSQAVRQWTSFYMYKKICTVFWLMQTHYIFGIFVLCSSARKITLTVSLSLHLRIVQWVPANPWDNQTKIMTFCKRLHVPFYLAWMAIILKYLNMQQMLPVLHPITFTPTELTPLNSL